MAWSTVPIATAAGTQLAKLSYIQEIANAWNERANAGGHTTITVPSAGDVAFSAAAGLGLIMQRIKSAIEAGTKWVQSHETDGTARATGFYDNQSAITMWTAANFCNAADIGDSSGSWWTRSTGAYGNPVAGDVVIPENFNEVYRALNIMVWTKHAGTFDRNGENNYRKSNIASTYGTEAAAKAAAEADFNAYTATSNANNPLASYTVHQTAGSQWGAELWRVYQYCAFSSIYAGLNHIMEAYVPGTTLQGGFTSNVYDAQGDTLNGHAIYQTNFNLVETMASSATATRLGATKIGKNGATDYPPNAPASPGASETNAKGWEIQSTPTGIARWNIASGFTYV